MSVTLAVNFKLVFNASIGNSERVIVVNHADTVEFLRASS